jgi:diaminopimelate epimerase
MCGNGARCTARFAYLNRIAGADMSFETEAGIVHAEVRNERVKINLPDPADLKMDYTIDLKSGPLSVCSINTGVPHVVITAEDLSEVDVVNLGREIRFHQQYAPAGSNVNFISLLEGGGIAIRTYERGVEDETLACGTGAVASAIVSAAKFDRQSPVDVLTRSGGHLNIYFDAEKGHFKNIFLEGDARVIYKGELWEDAWM